MEWIIVQLSDIQPGDLWRHPDHQGLLYLITKVFQRSDSVILETGQARTFELRFLELPILVKRLVECGWPMCELHCGKCMRFAESETRRAELLQNGVNV
jgi:hypothetical protein